MERKQERPLTPKRRRVLEILASGKYSAADITLMSYLSDPRSYIRHLRDKGYNIADEWRRNSDGDGRYKVYYLSTTKTQPRP